MSDRPLQLNGWDIYAHPLFLDQLESLVSEVVASRERDPLGYASRRPAKLLAAVLKVAFEVVPEDPTRAEYRQGDTLGSQYRHWFRAKFLQQYRLFFRYREDAGRRVIVLAWVNDDRSLRAYGSRSDAYAVFRKMLHRGNPPDDWDTLLTAAQGETARLKRSRPASRPRP
ncbi:type II toxin-antitoxin system YhaV family toxin [Methylobacterium sp. J-026]|uniref:type II toxin-antitoxin system YhaV family toxin n=1 Tax=Methylobacterium sp. J-026 TaxID=2836624 RepID=UPI001FB9A228|nr:type II toxin-antitoxin system YhaV family toxin [Methylobacterium sp. J-026]MCJ2136117.1 type II toxin-antitoxin system YhaV family toxin [Methylobacterium sp. J-026]